MFKKIIGTVIGLISSGWSLMVGFNGMFAVGMGSISRFSLYHILFFGGFGGAVLILILLIRLWMAKTENINFRLGLLIVSIGVIAGILYGAATLLTAAQETRQQEYADERSDYVNANCIAITKPDFSYKKCPNSYLYDEVDDNVKEKYNAYITEYQNIKEINSFSLAILEMCAEEQNPVFNKPQAEGTICSTSSGTHTTKWNKLPEGWEYGEIVFNEQTKKFKVYFKKPANNTFVVCSSRHECDVDTEKFLN